jgi:hypothetical protein
MTEGISGVGNVVKLHTSLKNFGRVWVGLV